jgi:hypothetical protein
MVSVCDSSHQHQLKRKGFVICNPLRPALPLLLAGLLSTTACHSEPSAPAPASDATAVPAKTVTVVDGTRELDWLELMPADELEALQNAPAVQHDGNFTPLQEGTFNTVPEMDGLRGKIPGYIVPVDTDADGRLTEFFLVPYFGACIHVPPPPPNQIIHGRLSEPVAMTDIYAAYWIEGTLHTERFENDIAATAYTMTVDKVYLWE